MTRAPRASSKPAGDLPRQQLRKLVSLGIWLGDQVEWFVANQRQQQLLQRSPDGFDRVTRPQQLDGKKPNPQDQLKHRVHEAGGAIILQATALRATIELCFICSDRSDARWCGSLSRLSSDRDQGGCTSDFSQVVTSDEPRSPGSILTQQPALDCKRLEQQLKLRRAL